MTKPVFNVLVDDNDRPYIQLVEPYPGVCFQLGEVKFAGTDEEPVLQFDYDIIEGKDTISNIEEFEKFAAELLLDLIDKRLKEGNLLMTGGT